jgi:hypothetical protein
MDGWANPLLVEAMGRSREGLVDVTGATTWAPALPSLADPAQVLRWDPWVRLSLLQDELQEGLSVRPVPGAASTMAVTLGGRALLTLSRPGAGHFQHELRRVLSLAALREDRAPEILAQIDGQWAFWGQLLPFRLAQTPTLVELMNLAIQFCVSVELRLKHAFACPRPHELSHAVRPMITTPGHGTYPMGHATQVEAVRVVLMALLTSLGLPQGAPNAHGHGPLAFDVVSDELCKRIAENRVVAGVHFPVDGSAGLLLGRVLGRYLVGALSGRRLMPQAKVPAFPLQADDRPEDWRRNAAITQADLPLAESPASTPENVPSPVLLPVVWSKAIREVRISLGLNPGAGAT